MSHHMNNDRQLVIFDLDHTLIPLDSEMEWMRFLSRQRAHLPRDPVADEMERRYDAGELGTDEYTAYVFGAMRGMAVDAAHELRQQFVDAHITPHLQSPLHTPVYELIAAHQKRDDDLILITGSSAFMTAPIVEALDIPHALGTVPEVQGGVFTGRIVGEACIGAGKITHLDRWLNARNTRFEDYAHTMFYSDSTYDLPLLEKVHEPVATNPKPALKAIAQQRGWRILQLFPHD
jgi:HAD superfamily hydrolase (TIGR01490 family)